MKNKTFNYISGAIFLICYFSVVSVYGQLVFDVSVQPPIKQEATGLIRPIYLTYYKEKPNKEIFEIEMRKQLDVYIKKYPDADAFIGVWYSPYSKTITKDSDCNSLYASLYYKASEKKIMTATEWSEFHKNRKK